MAGNKQDITSRSMMLSIGQQRGVDLTFTSKEMTLDIDRFSERYCKPAAAVLAARMESDAQPEYFRVAPGPAWDRESKSGFSHPPTPPQASAAHACQGFSGDRIELAIAFAGEHANGGSRIVGHHFCPVAFKPGPG